MAARDRKTRAMTEVLHGIRQIKFSASESYWQSAILAERASELAGQWRVYMLGIYLTFCWFSMPILLSAASLTVYACLEGRMTPAITFTALALFTRLEFSLSVVPNIISQLQEARVSLRRIQQHLRRENHQPSTVGGNELALKRASIAWSSNGEDLKGFRLLDMTLCFPNKGLR